MINALKKVQAYISSDLVRSHIENFWGYGNLEAPVWFVGMEEGLGDADRKHLNEHFRVLQGKQTADIRADNRESKDHLRRFQSGADLQRTWMYPIALYLYLKNGRVPLTEEIREYQIANFANPDLKETAAIELMPLPAKKADEGTWIYRDLDVPGLSNRAEYLATYKPERVRKLQDLLRQYKPSLVIFHSLTYLPDWTNIIGTEPEKVTRGMHFAKPDTTAFCVIPQGSSPGMSYARLFEFAEKVRDRIHVS